MPQGFVLEGLLQGAGDAFAQALRERNERRRVAAGAAAKEQQRQVARKESLEDFENQLRLRESFKVEGEKRSETKGVSARNEGLDAFTQFTSLVNQGNLTEPQAQSQHDEILKGLSLGGGKEFISQADQDANNKLDMFENGEDPEIDEFLKTQEEIAFKAGYDDPEAYKEAQKKKDVAGLEKLAAAAAASKAAAGASQVLKAKRELPDHVKIGEKVLDEETAISNFNELIDDLEGVGEDEGLRKKYEEIEIGEGFLGIDRLGKITTEDKEDARKQLNKHIAKINEYAAGLRKMGIEVEDVEEIGRPKAWEAWWNQLSDEQRAANEELIKIAEGRVTREMIFDKYGK